MVYAGIMHKVSNLATFGATWCCTALVSKEKQKSVAQQQQVEGLIMKLTMFKCGGVEVMNMAQRHRRLACGASLSMVKC